MFLHVRAREAMLQKPATYTRPCRAGVLLYMWAMAETMPLTRGAAPLRSAPPNFLMRLEDLETFRTLHESRVLASTLCRWSFDRIGARSIKSGARSALGPGCLSLRRKILCMEGQTILSPLCCCLRRAACVARRSRCRALGWRPDRKGLSMPRAGVILLRGVYVCKEV